ncbi:MAG: hypothetical protein KI790_14140 [Cyclobacteriaceae bacterium]|nr:hypothetical protein [Cyclobacteriaceae bacterium HetDA_MAG_MS6]
MKYYISLFSLAVAANLFAQSSDLPVNHDAYYLLDRLHVKGDHKMHTTFRPYSRKSFAPILSAHQGLTASQAFNLQYLQVENREYTEDTTSKAKKLFWGKFYRFRSDGLSKRDANFDFHLNPVLQLSLGYDSGIGKRTFINTRGVEMRGTIDNKVSFYTFVSENQIEYPQYVKDVADTVGLIPYEGFWKEFDGTTTDFFRATGHIDFNVSKHIGIQVGYGRHFIGSGERSLILSDFSNNYPYLRLSTEIWKFKYTNLFAEMIGDVGTFSGGTLGTGSYTKKFLALHHLDMRITPKLHIGLFESVIYGRPDSIGGSNLRFEYMNPVIFYRALEQQDGSSDNVIIGTDFKWKAWKRALLYGQFVLDELIISKFLAGDGAWENKYGVQIGMRYYDFALSDLDLQVEYNLVRPFTYAHQDLYTSYTHYEQPLAHPLGANLTELLISARYQPSPKLTLKATLLTAQYGNNIADSINVGRDPLISYNDRETNEGFDQNGGVKTNLLLGNGMASYQIIHNLFVDLNYTWRREESPSISVTNTTSTFSFGLRWNIAARNYFF